MRRILGSAFLAVSVLAFASAPGRGDDKKVNLEGTYVLVGMEAGGQPFPADLIAKSPETERTIKITGTQFIPTKKGKEEVANYKINTSKTPYQIDLTSKGKDKEEKMMGIFKVEGDKLIICMVESDKAEDRPKEFKTTKGGKTLILTLQKKKK
jgi:uncharacterized protein (TIGR03067 family)